MRSLSTLLMFILLASAAAGSVGDGFNVSVVGRNGDGPSEAIAFAEGLVFHGRGSILEVLDRTTLVRLGQIELSGLVQDIAYRDDLLFVAAGAGGLRIVAVSDPAHPVEIGHLDGLGYPFALALHGDLVLMVYANDGMVVIDAADPAAPLLLASVPIADFAMDVDVHGDRAVVAEGPRGLEFFDLSDPTQPVSLFVEGTVDAAWDLQVVGDLAFTAETIGVSVYDLAAPDVEHVATLGLDPYPTILAVAGDVLLAVSYRFGFRLVDVSDPEAMSSLSYTPSTTRVYTAAFDGRFACLAGSVDGLRIIDAANPADPLEVATLATPGQAGQVAVAGDLAAFASPWAGLRLVDLADLAHPVDLAMWRDTGDVNDVDLVGSMAYVSQGLTGIGVIDVSDPGSPVEVGRFAPPGFPVNALAIVGSLGYAGASYAPCLRILDLAAPAAPVEIAALDVEAYVAQVAVSGDRAYLAAHDQGLLVVDVGDPQGPDLLQRLGVNGDAALVAVAGGHAFVISTFHVDFDYGSRLRIYDTSGNQVTFLAELPLEAWVRSMTVELPYVYLGGDAALLVVDVSVPTAPTEVGDIQLAMTPSGLFARDRNVVVGDEDTGIWVVHNDHTGTAVQLTGPAARREPDGVRLSWETTAPLGISSYTVWRQEDGGPRVVAGSLAARDPFAYAFVDDHASATACAYWVEGVFGSGDSVWFGPASLLAITDGVASLRCRPNPVRSEAIFAFALPGPATVRLEVFDLRGRRVASLQSGEYGAGTYQVAWDRRDDGGRPVAAGAYLARLSGADFVRTAKVLVRD